MSLWPLAVEAEPALAVALFALAVAELELAVALFALAVALAADAVADAVVSFWHLRGCGTGLRLGWQAMRS